MLVHYYNYREIHRSLINDKIRMQVGKHEFRALD
jgi:hypothetical protein